MGAARVDLLIESPWTERNVVDRVGSVMIISGRPGDEISVRRTLHASIAFNRSRSIEDLRKGRSVLELHRVGSHRAFVCDRPAALVHR